MSLAAYRTLGAPADILAVLDDIGVLCTDLERWDDAARAFGEAAQIANALGDMPSRIFIEIHRAALDIARGHLTAARTTCEFALELSLQTPNGVGRGEIERQRGTIAREAGELSASEEYFERAQAIASERHDLLLEADTARERAALYRKQGRNRDALIYLNRAGRLVSQMPAASAGRRRAQIERALIDAVRQWASSIESKDHYSRD
jgi:tetratricopeptide (TPR) repeat protein